VSGATKGKRAARRAEKDITLFREGLVAGQRIRADATAQAYRHLNEASAQLAALAEFLDGDGHSWGLSLMLKRIAGEVADAGEVLHAEGGA
jgi:hypothetical protein